jgi:hypothetical protein
MYHVHVYNLQLTRLQACKEISTFRFSDKKKGGGGDILVKLGTVMSLEFKKTPIQLFSQNENHTHSHNIFEVRNLHIFIKF